MKNIFAILIFLSFPINSFAWSDTWTAKDSNRNWNSASCTSDASLCVATVFGGQIYISNDLGNTWTAKDSNRNWSDSFCNSDGSYCFATAYGGQIYVSSDFGNTWTAKDSNRNWSGISGSSDGTIIISLVNGGQIYISTDFGNTWTAKDLNRNWGSITCIPDGYLCIAGGTAMNVYTSSDRGNTWIARDTGNLHTFAWSSSISCTEDGMTCLGGDEYWSEIRISRDYGITWNTLIYIDDYPRGVYSSPDGVNGLQVYHNNSIYKSEDSFDTWQTIESSRIWRSVDCSYDNQVCIATVYGGQLYIATNPLPPTPSMEFLTEDLVSAGAIVELWITIFSGIIATIYIISIRIGEK